MEELWFRGELKEIGREESWDLLASRSVGRIGYATDRGAVVLPVNHAVIGDAIVVRIAPSGQTARYLQENSPAAELSYEVDDFDEVTQSGWSVLVMGSAKAGPPEALFSSADRPIPWPAGDFWEYIRIQPGRVTGRRLLAA